MYVNSILEFRLQLLFTLVNMFKFSDGKVHFRNQGMKGLIMSNSHLKCFEHEGSNVLLVKFASLCTMVAYSLILYVVYLFNMYKMTMNYIIHWCKYCIQKKNNKKANRLVWIVQVSSSTNNI